MIKNKLNKLVGIILTVGIVASLVGCGKSNPQTENTNSNVSKQMVSVDKIKKAGKLVLGTSADYPPYEFHKEINGKDEIVGFDIEIAKEVAKDLGVQLEIKDMKFDGLLAALDTGKVDMVVSGMTPTEERKKNVDFSNLYYKAVQSVIVRTEDKDKYKVLEDLKGKKIAVQKGSVQEKIAAEQIKGAEAKGLGKVSDEVLEIKNNKVDGIIVELPVAQSYVAKNPDLSISDLKIKSADEGSAIAVKKGSSDLVDAINSTLTKLNNNKTIDKFVTDANKMVE